jgi:hypothetical protein
MPKMPKWEYARLESTDAGINVVFTHRQAWTGLAPEAFFETLRRLGDDGWELVAALPLLATAAPVAVDAAPAREQAGRERIERYGQAPPPEPPATTTWNVRIGTDRWLVFKRAQPEAAPQPSGAQSADVLKGLGGQLLKGRLPLP